MPKLNKLYSRKQIDLIRNDLINQHGDQCSICKRPRSDFKNNLSVDHAHDSGKIRGLLCFTCNKHLVGKHSLESAKNVYEYLLKYDPPVSTEEIWLPIPGFESYQVSNLGRVKNAVSRLLSPNNNGKGYLSVQLGRNNRRYVHALVMLAFVGPSNLEINHKNLDKSDNSLINLEYVTRRQNQQHMITNGKHNRAKLTQELADLIRSEVAMGVSRKELMRKFNVSKTTISNILKGKTWNWNNIVVSSDKEIK